MRVLRSLIAGAAVLAVAASGATASVTVWQGAMAGSRGTSPDTTARTVARISTTVHHLRIRLSNQFGSTPLLVSGAWVGRAADGGGPALVSGTNRRVTFGGAARVRIAPGKTRWSDVVAVTIPGGGQAAVTVRAPGQTVSGKNYLPYSTAPTSLFLSVPGAHGTDTTGAAFPTTTVSLQDPHGNPPPGYYPGQGWWVDAIAGDAQAQGTVVFLGDSITEGWAGYGPPGQRFSDILGARLGALPASRRMAVSNAAISGDIVTVEPNPYMPPTDPYDCCGVPIPQRLGRDVIDMPGVRTVFLMAGTNDIGGAQYGAPVPGAEVIASYQRIIARLHAHHLRVVGSTLIPMGLPPGSVQETARQQVNAWIRQGIGWDAVVDMDHVVRDPAVPWQILPAWASSTVLAPTGGVYHPNAAGHAAMAAALATGLLTGP